MHTLKSALGKQNPKDQKSVSTMGQSFKNYNKSKSESMWALNMDNEDDNNNEIIDEKVHQALSKSLNAFYNKDKNFSEIYFYQIVEEIQAIVDNKSELECLLFIEKQAKEIEASAKEDLKNYINSFSEILVKRIKKLKKREKKDQLQEYEKIVHTNFKKKAPVQFINENMDKKQYLEIKQNKMNRNSINSGEKKDGSSKNSGSSASGDKKLSNLLSNEKLKEEKDRNLNNQENLAEESVSFSAVISQSMAVRSRKGRQNEGVKPAKKQKQPMKKEMDAEDQDLTGNKDEGFIFYRPKTKKQ